MKKITLLLSFIACVAFTQAQTLLVEDFDYNANSVLLNQGNWKVTGSNSAAPFINVTASSITYSGYSGSGIGNEVTLTNGEDLYKNFTAQTTGVIYTSFLVNVTAAPTNGDYFIHYGPTDMAANAYIGRTFVKASREGKIVFGLMQASSGTATYLETVYDLNTTYLIVLKHELAEKRSSIIVNPATTTEPTTGWLTNDTGNNSTANIGAIGLRQPSLSAALTAKLDGIRVATSWAALFATSNVINPSASKFQALVVGNDLQIKNVANGATVEIFSALGSKVQTSVLENGKVSVDNLSKGMYIVRVGKNTQKFML